MASPGIQRMSALRIAEIACRQVEVTLGDQISRDAALDFVNQGLAELHDILTSAYEDHFLGEHDFAAGVTRQAIPQDFLRAIRLFDTSTGLPLKRVTLDKLKSATLYPASWDGLYYRILGTQVHFSKEPPAVVTMYYVPQFVPLLNLEDEVAYSVPVSWYRYVVADFTARLLAEEETNFVFYEGRKQEMRQQFIEAAAPRDMEPEPIRDTEPMDFLEGY